MAEKYVIALDLGTTGNRAIAFARDGAIAANAYYEFEQKYPQPAWVEHDPEDIVKSTLKALREVVDQVGADAVHSLGITNQRETVVVWNKSTGKPVYNAIVWQCRRTTPECHTIQDKAAWIKEKTGLFLDPYFSATKIQWILNNVTGARKQAEDGQLLFGTVDTWILWNLTKGKSYYTEASNASRTLLFNIVSGQWDAELLRLFTVPAAMLPEVKNSADDFGCIDPGFLGREIPINGVLGDQQAALFAQGGWDEGVVKNTYGTGLFVVTSTGDTIPPSGKLINTIAWKRNGHITYALEGSIFVGGSAVQWLRDGLKIIDSAQETEAMALALPDNENVYFVPALAGLGAPYWDPEARGSFLGLTRGTTRNHMVRATLESLAYQTRDVIEEMQRLQPNRPLSVLRVDGGAIKNNFLMQFQSDILNVTVERPMVSETTALGSAAMAGIYSGFWTEDDFMHARQIERRFEAAMSAEKRNHYYAKWQQAVTRALKWA